MNSSLKSLIIFVAGAAVGSVSTYLAVRKAFELKADLEIDEVKRVYEDKVNSFEEHKSSLNGDFEGEKEIEGDKPLSHREIVERLNNKPNLRDYTKYFKEKGERIEGVTETLRDAKEAADLEGLSEEELAERETPPDDIPYTDEEDRQQSIDVIDHELNGASRDAIAEGRLPYEIEASDFELTCGNYDKISLSYYVFDQLVTNDEEELIDESVLIGSIIEDTGFDQDERDALYVRNDKILCDFEITKVYEAYGKDKE